MSEYEKYVNFNNTSNIYNNTNEYDYHGNRTDPYTSISLDNIDNNKNFIPLRSNELSLTDIENINDSKVAGLFKTKSKNKKFVLVEESKLAGNYNDSTTTTTTTTTKINTYNPEYTNTYITRTNKI
jgi:hypothetical protein